MSRLKDRFSLLIGNLWQPDQAKISNLRTKFPTLAESQIFSRINLQQNASIANASELPGVAATTIINSQQHEPLEETPKQAHTALRTTINEPSAQPIPVNNDDQRNFSDWDDLVTSALNCEKCKLCYGRKHVVVERGNRKAKWMFVGEGPGEQEDLQGKPFVGASGQLLNKMIAAMNLNSELDVYIANVVKCRPPHNRNPEVDEIAACSNYLKSQINLVQPQIIITLGRYAAQTLLQTDLAIGKLRNKVHQYAGKTPLIVTYHPSYLLRTPTAKKDAWADLQLAMKIFGQV